MAHTHAPCCGHIGYNEYMNATTVTYTVHRTSAEALGLVHIVTFRPCRRGNLFRTRWTSTSKGHTRTDSETKSRASLPTFNLLISRVRMNFAFNSCIALHYSRHRLRSETLTNSIGTQWNQSFVVKSSQSLSKASNVIGMILPSGDGII